MKIEITLTKAEAQKMIGDAIKQRLAGNVAADLEVDSVRWESYGQGVEIILTPPEPPQVVAAPEAA